MLRQNSSNIEPDPNQYSTPSDALLPTVGGGELQQELNRLEEMILTSPHVPLTRRTLVDEEQLLDQLDVVRARLPQLFQEARAIVEQKKEIIFQAEKQAEEIIQAAHAKAAQILNEIDIVRQAEAEAKEILQQVQQECITTQEQHLMEINQARRQAQRELEEMRRQAIAEAEEIQQGADAYADSVLLNLEQQLGSMLQIVHNGRQQLYPQLPSDRNLPPSL